MARLAIALTLTLLSTLAFAHRVFPLISADKGGGNFSESRIARLCIGSLDQSTLPTELNPNKAQCSVPVAIIDSSDSGLWVSRTDDRGGALDDGEKCAPDVWTEGEFYPQVFEINRRNVSHILYERAPAKGDRVQVLGREAEVYEVLDTSDHKSRIKVRLIGSKTSERVGSATATLWTDTQTQSPSPIGK